MCNSPELYFCGVRIKFILIGKGRERLVFSGAAEVENGCWDGSVMNLSRKRFRILAVGTSLRLECSDVSRDLD